VLRVNPGIAPRFDCCPQQKGDHMLKLNCAAAILVALSTNSYAADFLSAVAADGEVFVVGMAASMAAVDDGQVLQFRAARGTSSYVGVDAREGAERLNPPLIFRASGLQFSGAYVTQGADLASFGLNAKLGSLTLAKVSYDFANGKGVSYAFGTDGSNSSFFGLAASGATPLSFGDESSRFNAPYFGLLSNAAHVGYSATLPSGVVLRFGAVRQISTKVGSQGASDELESTNADAAGKLLAIAEVQKSFGAITGVLTLGHLTETNSVMGMTGSGALSLKASPQTSFVTFAASNAIAEKTSLSVMASLGRTASYQNQAASVIDGASSSRTAAWSLGLARKDVFRSGDVLGLTASMPLKTMSGQMRVTTAVGQNPDDGALKFATQHLALRPTGTQKDLELSYARRVSFGGVLSAIALTKLQPGHDAQATSQFGVGVKYQRAF
jgi:hypothetical protein